MSSSIKTSFFYADEQQEDNKIMSDVNDSFYQQAAKETLKDVANELKDQRQPPQEIQEPQMSNQDTDTQINEGHNVQEEPEHSQYESPVVDEGDFDDFDFEPPDLYI